MSSHTYEPSTPTKVGLFPIAPMSPNAFAGFHQSASPIGSMLGKVLTRSSAQNLPNGSNSDRTFGLKIVRRKRN